MANYKPRATKPLTAVWLISAKESDPMSLEEFVMPEITVAVAWQADPRAVERDFGVIVSRIRDQRRKDLDQMKAFSVIRVAKRLRRSSVERAMKTARELGERDPLRVLEAGELETDWPSAQKIARAIGSDSWTAGSSHRVKKYLRRAREIHRKILTQTMARGSARRTRG